MRKITFIIDSGNEEDDNDLEDAFIILGSFLDGIEFERNGVTKNE